MTNSSDHPEGNLMSDDHSGVDDEVLCGYDVSVDEIEGLLEEDEPENITEEEAAKIKLVAHAASVVVNKLGIREFILKYGGRIFRKFEECERNAKMAGFGNDMMFIATVVPVVNGIIHVASSRHNLRVTTDWLKTQWGVSPDEMDPEKVPVVSALTLIYIVTLGSNIFTQISDAGLSEEKIKRLKERKALWKAMRERVQKVMNESDDKSINKSREKETDKSGN